MTIEDELLSRNPEPSGASRFEDSRDAAQSAADARTAVQSMDMADLIGEGAAPSAGSGLTFAAPQAGPAPVRAPRRAERPRRRGLWARLLGLFGIR